MKGVRKLLITGSAGRLGRHLCRELAPYYDISGFDRVPHADLAQQTVANLADIEALKRACDHQDVVVHLAGNPGASTAWPEILEANIDGTYNLFEAARQGGVRKVVFASTCQVTFGYGEHFHQTPSLVPRPTSLYAVSKVTGEMIAYRYAYEYAMDAICIRIGLFPDSGRLAANRQITGRFLGKRDAVQLFRRAIDALGVRYAVVYGASDSSRLNLDLESARGVLGYIPEEREDDLLSTPETGSSPQ
jgi:uronate dehydrogenase